MPQGPRIYVLAGPNGAGKSSIGGAMLRSAGAEYFNPDEAAARILTRSPGLSQEAANSAAWNHGRRLLERAIAERKHLAFETTLGGNTIPRLLAEAHNAGIEVRVWFIGLESPELHVARVRARVASGGHDIPEASIRERYDRSRMNLIRLMPRVAELFVYDNSRQADPQREQAPEPKLILHMVGSRVTECCKLTTAPNWTKPILAAAMKISRRQP
ncbi:MAG: AAA family ATPase [Terriglobales bacterium]